jgi:hypothetical protein
VRQYGLAVSLPPGWRLAPRTLTHLVDPREIMTATTLGTVALTRSCTPFPAVRLARGGAVVTLEERAGGVVFARRPRRFAPTPASPVVVDAVRACLGASAAVSLIDFSDGARSFEAIVVVDARASASVRNQAFAILDRLRFDQSFVPWWPAAGGARRRAG